MTARYEIQKSEKLGRYLVAAKDLGPGESILTDTPFVLGPGCDTALLCFNCYQQYSQFVYLESGFRPTHFFIYLFCKQVISKFLVCKNCAVAPICPGDGCPDHLAKWHNKPECDFFRDLKLSRGLSPMTMVQNVGSLIVLRALLKRKIDPQAWDEFMQLETHLEERRDSSVWEYYENTVKFIESLGLLEDIEDRNLVQKICAIIDVNSFEVRGPAIPALGCAEILRGMYLKAALLAHDCTGNTHMSINNNNLLVCHASTSIKKGETIYYNYTDSLKGTAIRQQHLQIGKYFKCTCQRCSDPTELGTYLSAALCPHCKTGYASQNEGKWICHSCKKHLDAEVIGYKVECCSNKLGVINKKDENELEEYIRNVSLVLSPSHYLLLEAKQRLAGVLRDAINREPRPANRLMRRKIELCQEILPVLEKISPGICRTKAITLYELQASIVQLAKKKFDAREITGSAYLDELTIAEQHLKRSLEMLFIEPGNSPEGELCAKALEEYRALKSTMSGVLDGIHAGAKTYVSATERNEPQPTVN